MKKVIVLTGPTAVGKTEYSLIIANDYNCEIINADASQFRKDLNIGTAKIDCENTSIKHHLINIIQPNEFYSIMDYQGKARKLIEEITSRDKIPLIIGGSGLYINSVIYAYDLSQDKRSDNIEEQYKSYSNEYLHKILEELDYDSSLKIHYNNRKRVLRAIEASINGKKISENICNNELLYDATIICLMRDRDDLYYRINQRVDEMFDNGWIEECIKLRDKHIELDKLTDIGYKEINEYLLGNLSLDEVKNTIKQKTRNYAKRQVTWFKNKMTCEFINLTNKETKQVIKEIHDIINS